MEDQFNMTYQVRRWTNPSVIAMAGINDPIAVIQASVREKVLEAAQSGWEGPPYDPFSLAEILDVDVSPNNDIFDARTLTDESGEVRIEFNPNRPHGRIRFSVAHEIVHTLFPDCAERVRNREEAGGIATDEWQLELLCNVGAAEILMPSGYAELRNTPVGIDNLLKLRQQFDVSTEALLLRIAKLTAQPCAIFAAARDEGQEGMEDSADYRIDYGVPSRSWPFVAPSDFRVQDSQVLTQCTAVGYTAKGRESWGNEMLELNVECVGIPPYPGSRFPRVVGVITPTDEVDSDALHVTHLFGDAMSPRESGPCIIAHIVNDSTPNWGRGFASEVGRRWSFVQDDFREWAGLSRENLRLGNVHVSGIDGELSIAHMVAQRGYGSSIRTRLRYAALSRALGQLSEIASERRASVHMPRIGTGQARGSWELVQELIDESLVRRGVPVYVYTLPDSVPAELQGTFNLDN